RTPNLPPIHAPQAATVRFPTSCQASTGIAFLLDESDSSGWELSNLAPSFTIPAMTKRLITVQELGRRGGLARARKYSKRQLRKWGKLGGRPLKNRRRKD